MRRTISSAKWRPLCPLGGWVENQFPSPSSLLCKEGECMSPYPPHQSLPSFQWDPIVHWSKKVNIMVLNEIHRFMVIMFYFVAFKHANISSLEWWVTRAAPFKKALWSADSRRRGAPRYVTIGVVTEAALAFNIIFFFYHYNDAMMCAVASQIAGLLKSLVCSAVCSGLDQRKPQSSASLAFVGGIHRSPMNSPHEGPVTRKWFNFMTSSCVESTILTFIVLSPIRRSHRSNTLRCSGFL